MASLSTVLDSGNKTEVVKHVVSSSCLLRLTVNTVLIMISRESTTIRISSFEHGPCTLDCHFINSLNSN